MDIDSELNENERDKWLNSLEGKRFSMKKLSYGMDCKIFHECYDNCSNIDKALMMARRSKGTLSFINHYYGNDFAQKIFIGDKKLNITWRLLYGMNITDNSKKVKFNCCNGIFSGKNIFLHIFECRFGLSHSYRHDQVIQ